jgi:hypothetical protein
MKYSKDNEVYQVVVQIEACRSRAVAQLGYDFTGCVPRTMVRGTHPTDSKYDRISVSKLEIYVARPI